MIRVAAMFPNAPGASFNLDYYTKTHLPLVRQRLGAALVGLEFDRGVGTVTPGDPAPYHAIGYMKFQSIGDFQKAMGEHGPALMGDIPNFYGGQPAFQISEIG